MPWLARNMRQRGTDDGRCTQQVHPDHPLPVVGGDLVECAAGIGPGGGEHRVQPPVDPGEELLHGALGVVGVRQVRVLPGHLGLRFVAVDDQSGAAPGLYRVDDGGSEAGGAAGDQDVAERGVR